MIAGLLRGGGGTHCRFSIGCVFVSQHREAVLDQRQGSPSTGILPSFAEAAPLFVPSLAEEDKDKLGQQQSSETEALLHLAPAAFASEILPPHCRQGQRPR